MRSKLLLVLSLALAATSFLQEAQAQFVVWKDGQPVYADYTGVPDYFEMKAADKPAVKESQAVDRSKVGGAIAKESEAIDLGLSVKWAPWNLGASQPSDYGEYFAWGEVVPETDENGNYLSYDWDTYYWMAEGKSDWTNITKYQAEDFQYAADWYDHAKDFIGDGKTTIESSDDAATANWGGKWRMPTQAELAELSNSDNCEWTWTDNYNESGHSGYVVKSKKTGYEDAVLFLPAAGYRWRSNLDYEGSYGYYWSSELSPWNSNYARDLYFYSGGHGADGYSYRYNGFSVRAVCPPAE